MRRVCVLKATRTERDQMRRWPWQHRSGRGTLEVGNATDPAWRPVAPVRARQAAAAGARHPAY
jgi:hypothetical protein